MTPFLIFVVVCGAMAAMSFWEAYVEGRNPWDKRKLGWCLKLGKFKLPAYHFYVFIVMIPMLLSLPLVIYGWNLKLFGIIFSAYMVGILLEDFLWFIVNPAVNFKKDFNPDFASYYPWIKIGKFQIPAGYPVSVFLSLLSWYFLWR